MGIKTGFLGLVREKEWVWLGREKWVRSAERMLRFVMGSLRGRRVEVVFVMVGSVRGSSEAEMGLAAWVEGREVRLGLREKEENKKKERR